MTQNVLIYNRNYILCYTMLVRLWLLFLQTGWVDFCFDFLSILLFLLLLIIIISQLIVNFVGIYFHGSQSFFLIKRKDWIKFEFGNLISRFINFIKFCGNWKLQKFLPLRYATCQYFFQYWPSVLYLPLVLSMQCIFVGGNHKGHLHITASLWSWIELIQLWLSSIPNILIAYLRSFVKINKGKIENFFLFKNISCSWMTITASMAPLHKSKLQVVFVDPFSQFRKEYRIYRN